MLIQIRFKQLKDILVQLDIRFKYIRLKYDILKKHNKHKKILKRKTITVQNQSNNNDRKYQQGFSKNVTKQYNQLANIDLWWTELEVQYFFLIVCTK